MHVIFRTKKKAQINLLKISIFMNNKNHAKIEIIKTKFHDL